MADSEKVSEVSKVPAVAEQNGNKRGPPPGGKPGKHTLNQIYALPAPIRTFPLPTFIPNNPISLFHIIYTWVSQYVSPPSSHPEVLYKGLFSPMTRSVHITDPETMRALWEQGFYGKGTLSRSDPSWLAREKKKRGAGAGRTSEEYTRKRREQRQQVKWERARKEREAIDQKLEEERRLAMAAQKLPSPSPEIKPVEEPDAVPEVEEEKHLAMAAQRSPSPSPELKPVELSVPVDQLVPDAAPKLEEEMHLAVAARRSLSPSPERRLVEQRRVSDAAQLLTPTASPEPEENRPQFHVKAPVGPLELLSLPNSSSDLSLMSQSTSSASDTPLIIEEVHSSSSIRAPVGPFELLSLPNSSLELSLIQQSLRSSSDINLMPDEVDSSPVIKAPVGPLEILSLPNSSSDLSLMEKNSTFALSSFSQLDTTGASELDLLVAQEKIFPDVPIPSIESKQAIVQDEVPDELDSEERAPEKWSLRECVPPPVEAPGFVYPEVEAGTCTGCGTTETHQWRPGPAGPTTLCNDCGLGYASLTEKVPKRQKSVRFSPTVEHNTFIQTEPPSPELAEANNKLAEATKGDEETLEIENQEHLQLMLEEAFFLSYGLGVLNIIDPATQNTVPAKDLLPLFRRHSSFPPPSQLAYKPCPDDNFMLNYVVYHHYRSLGWVVRSGIKFSVDFLLYNRGPVFSHAEFAVQIMPSYSDPYWTSDPFLTKYVKSKTERPWSWLHAIMRVNSQVKKTLVLVYVDVPKPLCAEEEEKLGVEGLMKRYKVKEVVLRRWVSNRMRD